MVKSFIFLKLASCFFMDEKDKDGFYRFKEEAVEAYNNISKATGARMILLDEELPLRVTRDFNPFISMLLFRDFIDTTAVFGRVMSQKAITTMYDEGFEMPEIPTGFYIDHWELNHLSKPFKANPALGKKYEVWENNAAGEPKFIGMRRNERGKDYKMVIFSAANNVFENKLYLEQKEYLVKGEKPCLDLVAAEEIIKRLKT